MTRGYTLNEVIFNLTSFIICPKLLATSLMFYYVFWSGVVLTRGLKNKAELYCKIKKYLQPWLSVP